MLLTMQLAGRPQQQQQRVRWHPSWRMLSSHSYRGVGAAPQHSRGAPRGGQPLLLPRRTRQGQQLTAGRARVLSARAV
jgi:hypothetical protein